MVVGDINGAIGQLLSVELCKTDELAITIPTGSRDSEWIVASCRNGGGGFGCFTRKLRGTGVARDTSDVRIPQLVPLTFVSCRRSDQTIRDSWPQDPTRGSL